MAKVYCVLKSDHGFLCIKNEMHIWTDDVYEAKIFSNEEELGEFEEMLVDVEEVKINRVPVVICVATAPEIPEEPKRHLEVVK